MDGRHRKAPGGAWPGAAAGAGTPAPGGGGAHQGAQGRHLRHRRAHLQLGPLGGGAHQAPHDRRPRVCGGGGRPGGRRHRPAAGPAGVWRGAHRLPPLPQRQHSVVQGHGERGGGPGRGLRRVRLHPGDQRDSHRGTGCTKTPAISEARWRSWASTCCPGSTPLSP